MDLPHLTAINPHDIIVFKRLGSGLHGDVFEAKIASFANGMTVALKVFKAYHYPNYGYVLSKAGFELSPFDRELRAYSVIQGDSEANVNLPVIEAFGWFEIPAQLRIGKFWLSEKDSLKVMVKKLAKGPHFNFELVDPEQMIRHRKTLNRLQIWIQDINEENFLAGQLVDLSSAYVLSDLMRPEYYNLDSQCPLLKVTILRHHGIFSNIGQPSNELVEREWEILLEKFRTDPSQLSRDARDHYNRTIVVQID